MRKIASLALMGLSMLLPLPALAQADYPNRPITLVVGYGAGGSTDLASRVAAAGMEKILGQPVVVENRTGGNGAVGTQAVFNAAPDGYTIGMTSGSIMTVLPWTMNLGFDPLQLTYVGSVLESYYALFSGSQKPWQNIDEFITAAKASPLVVANSGGFGIPDIAMAQVAQAAGGFEYRTVPTTGGGEQALRLLSGDVDVSPNSAAPTLQHVRSGALRPILILSPSWPELEAMGVPLSTEKFGFSTRNLSALVAPPGLPEDIRQKLEDALKQVMEHPAYTEQFRNVGELIEFKTGAEIRQAVEETQAVQRKIGVQLGQALAR